jgi:hypothetical protein
MSNISADELSEIKARFSAALNDRLMIMEEDRTKDKLHVLGSRVFAFLLGILATWIIFQSLNAVFPAVPAIDLFDALRIFVGTGAATVALTILVKTT